MRKLYNYDAWFAKGKFTLVRGVDFQCSIWSMSSQVRAAASRRGLRIEVVERDGGTLDISVKKEEPACQ